MDIVKTAYVDIGELGYSLYLSAHLRWLKENTNHSLAIITSSDRKCLYKNLADLILDVPDDFYERFIGKQNCFGIGSPLLKGLREYFQKMLPSGYMIPEGFNFGGNRGFLLNKIIYKPYTYNKKLEGKKKILIFPRYRNYPPFSRRNLPELFYVKLIEALCNEFHDYEIETIGLTSGSYDIEVDKDNYKNGVKESADLQDMINECQLAVVAIGGISSLPRFSLLQKVPTFIIGHQKRRLTEDDNWMKTKVGFYKVAEGSFAKFNFEECINKSVLFIKGINNDNN